MAAINATELTNDYLLLRDIKGTEFKITKQQLGILYNERMPDRAKEKVLAKLKSDIVDTFGIENIDPNFLDLDFDETTKNPTRLQLGKDG